MNSCIQCKADFVISEQDKQFYQKMDVPEPVLCMYCRREHLFVWRNQRNLYSRKCDKTGKQIISVFSPNSPYVVYDRDTWWGDGWDPLAYGQEFDFSKNFAEQYDALLHRVPMVGIFNGNCENSQYCNHVGEMKDCYLAFASWTSRKVLYGDNVWDDDTCADMLETASCSGCYELIQSTNCFNTKHSMNVERCNDSWFLFDCKDCTDCIACTNLRNKQYHIFNVPYSREEYGQKKQAHNLDTRSGIEQTKKQFQEMKKNAIHRFANLIKCEDSTGDNLVGAKNSHDCFTLRENIVDSAYCINGGSTMIDVYDGYGVGAQLERGYYCVDSGVQGGDLIFGVVVWGCQYAYYNYNCHACFEIIGCTGLRNKKYCILNKQYSQEEYEALKPRVIEHMRKTGEWGHPLPPLLSPFGHNETLAYEYTPRTKEECLALGFKWQDTLPGSFGKETKNPEDLPETISEIPDSIAKEILACKQCAKNYKIITQELQFYRSKNIPIPLFCPQCRYDARRALRNPHQLWRRQCMCNRAGHEHTGRCPIEFETTYSPNRPENVFCEACYRNEVV
ncbi:hypothetical protein HY732_02595 [Candidatus Uhrbacteria bacterium]|nr:hypothetical protein [Candidatus Uhrbacteria bacterium]